MGLLDQAVQNHTMWRIKLLAAMNGGPQMDIQICCSDTHCDLGKWLERENPLQSRAPDKWAHLRQAHTHFHHCVGDVAMQVERQQTIEARQSVFQGPFHQAMLDFIQAVEAMKSMQGPEKTKPLSWAKAPQDWEPKPVRKTRAPIKAHWA